MKAVLVKTPTGLRGSTPDDHEAWCKFRRKEETMPPGAYMRVEWSTPRNGAHHNKLFALLQLIVENSETFNTKAKALTAVKLAAGLFDLMVNPVTGEIVPVPQSISFEAMGQEDFEAFYQNAIDAVLQHILPQLDRAKADRLLDMIVEGWVR